VPKTLAPDGGELDAYLLGIKKPVKKAKGKCIAIIHRLNDDDDRITIVPDDLDLSDEEIAKVVHFQEQWAKYKIIR